MPNLSVKVNAKHQITIPKELREKLSIKAGDYLLLDVQDGMIILIPEPKRYFDHLQGLHGEIWKGIDVQKYIDGERGAWSNSTNDSTPLSNQ